jgi:L-lactate permease
MGFSLLAASSLIANTAPVAYRALGTPIMVPSLTPTPAKRAIEISEGGLLLQFLRFRPRRSS